MSWAQLPTDWMDLPYNKYDREYFESDQVLDALPNEEPTGLRTFVWQKDGSSSSAALMVLIALSIELGRQHFRERISLRDREPTVAMSLDKLVRVTGFARKSVVSGIGLLEEAGAVEKRLIGRANVYELLGLKNAGHWCQIPSDTLLRPDGALRMKEWPRNRALLDALKVYMALLAARNVAFNTASLSWTGIQRWTGIARRENLGTALSILFATHLISDAGDRDERSNIDKSRRYRITGLRPRPVIEVEIAPPAQRRESRRAQRRVSNPT